MCGYIGFINKDSINNKKYLIKKMTDKIAHRGPDGEKYHLDNEIAIGFRRLSIIGLKNGMQPIYNENKNLILVFNGEIYNYKIIKKLLEKKGHIFYTSSDSEVIIHLYEEYKEKMFHHLRGMFSFSIWNKSEKSLFLARDFFGIKPLYYGKFNKTFFFGSEIKSFLEHNDFKKELNLDALESYLSFQYSSFNETFFKGVYKLPPAHYAFFNNGKIKIKRYFQPSFKENNTKDLNYFINKINKTIQNSIKLHKVSDVEVGSFLSSGVDSSYIAANFNGDKTFTVGFDYDQYSEIKYAKKLSKFIGIKNKSKIISNKEYWNILPKIQYYMDEPLADPSAVALYFVSKIASKKVKVALSGEGADEFFCGYTIYKEPISLGKYQKLPKSIRFIFAKIANKLPKIKGRSFLIRGSKSVEERFIGNANIFSMEERKNILNLKTEAPSTNSVTKKFYEFAKKYDDSTKMQFIDINTWLVGDILLKADKMSMANSLEVRVPFLDKKVFKIAKTIPLNFKINKFNTKYVFRLASKKTLPDEVSNKEKLGFPVPIKIWLRKKKYYNKVKKFFLSPISKILFNDKLLLKLLDDHYNKKKDNSRKIWVIYIFILWYNIFFNKEDTKKIIKKQNIKKGEN